MIGILVVDKPRGISSSDVVVKVKKLLNEKKVGHMGTLDPLAEGVLPLGIGKATKLFDHYLKKTKEYIATFTFGKQTDTLDMEGEIVETSEVIPTKEQLEKAIKQSFIAVIACTIISSSILLLLLRSPVFQVKRTCSSCSFLHPAG